MTSVLQEVLEVNKMSIEALRKKYKELFNAEAPLTASRRQLIPKITYQLQVLAFGWRRFNCQRKIDDLNEGKIPGYAQSKNSINLPAGTSNGHGYSGGNYTINVTDEDCAMKGNYKS